MTGDDLQAHARAILDANLYLTLGTVDEQGRPWTSPVYFAGGHDGDFYWVSAVDALHSRHLADRPHVSLVVFDSTVEPYHGRAVYGVGEATELSGGALHHGLTVYPRADGRGAAVLTAEDVTPPSEHRLYRVTVAELWVLCPREPRQPCALHGIAGDHRAAVPTGRPTGT